MCKAIEEMIEEATEKTARETARETAKNLFINGVDLETIIKSMPTLTEDELIAIYEEACNTK